jgi:hypothetical protein
MSFSRCFFNHFDTKEPLKIWRQPLPGVPSGLLSDTIIVNRAEGGPPGPYKIEKTGENFNMKSVLRSPFGRDSKVEAPHPRWATALRVVGLRETMTLKKRAIDPRASPLKQRLEL